MLLAAALVIPAVRSRAMRAVSSGLISRILGGRLRNSAECAVSCIDRTSQLLGGKKLVLGKSLGAVAWGPEACAFWYLTEALGYNLPLLPLLPATAFRGLYAASVTIICGLATLWHVVVIRLVALGAQSSTAGQTLDVAAVCKR